MVPARFSEEESFCGTGSHPHQRLIDGPSSNFVLNIRFMPGREIGCDGLRCVLRRASLAQDEDRGRCRKEKAPHPEQATAGSASKDARYPLPSRPKALPSGDFRWIARIPANTVVSPVRTGAS